ncbi:LOW QUALITY PROTEIN: spondin-2-like [Lethenteron reissneri]|uniref:LOW QUALITY PROTEIN: spondin-2-like n=1 Tax=Lethenteron reissneri TaxID=7753 RepID=UPI002AB6FCB0|nr:LOW QUALITY PROTEIN: spondin-2-like [Lethenteron reissneri]
MRSLPPVGAVCAALASCFCCLCCVCGAPTGSPYKCSAGGHPKYQLVFTGRWSQTSFPKQYPLFRPPAQWSSLVAVVHGRPFQMWRASRFASPGVREMSERGEAWGIMREVDAHAQARTAAARPPAVAGVFSAPALPNGTGQSLTELEFTAKQPLLSLMVRLVPSPDWFVGVDSLNLCEGEHWKERLSLDLQPYDAGTDNGFTFSSPNYATIPQEPITQSSSPSHPANSFYYPKLKQLPPLARLVLTRIGKRPHSSKKAPPKGNDIEQLTETPLDCEVAKWSPWGLCSVDTCGQPGVKRRTRYIRVKPANQGAPCPELEEEMECSAPNCSV